MPRYITNTPQLYCDHYYHDVWNIHIHLYWSESTERLRQIVSNNHDDGINITTMPDNFAGCYYTLLRNGETIPAIVLPFKWNKSLDQYSIIAHECLHAAIAMHRIRGISLPKDISPMENDEEGLTYLLDWLFLKVLNSLNEQDKHKFIFSNEHKHETKRTKR